MRWPLGARSLHAPSGGYGTSTAGSDPEREPVHEAWTTLAALAGLIPRLRLGCWSAATPTATRRARQDGGHRRSHLPRSAHPRPRASWQENEHRRYGIDYGTAADRADRLEEAATMITALFSEGRASHQGKYYRLENAPLEPKPLQSPLPLLIGGGGERRTLLTAGAPRLGVERLGTPGDPGAQGAILDAFCATRAAIRRAWTTPSLPPRHRR